jgi:tetratricopeptide (TPR) repeat protein
MSTPEINAALAHHPDKVAAWCYSMIKENPDNLTAYKLLAKSLNRQDRSQVSIRAYQVAERLEPNLTLHDRIDWANALASCDRHQEALKDYQQAIGDKSVILFFSPDTGVAPHFAAQCVLAKTLQELGHTVIVLPCGDLFQPFLLPSLEQTEQWFHPQTINACNQQYRSAGNRFLTQYGLPNLDPKAFWTTEMSDEVSRAINSLPDDLKNFQYNKIAFGKIALFDLALTTKHYDFNNPTAIIRALWVEFIKKNLTAHILLDSIYRFFKIQAGLHFNDYSLMLVHRLMGNRYEIPMISITQASHLNLDRRRYLVAPQTFRETSFSQVEYWQKYRDLSLPVSIVNQIGDDVLLKFRGTGSHVYSPSKSIEQPDLYKSLNLDPNRSLLVAYTSSRDEITSVTMGMEGLGVTLPTKEQPFIDQVAWLQALTKFIEESNNLQLVVRIHPRESKNKRDSQVSQHLDLLLSHFSRPFQHCRFIWPEDPISSYDLAEIADLVLTSWSSMGLECARLGIPVLTATNGIAPFPHDDFLEWGQTPNEYFRNLNHLVARPASLETIARAFRWYNLNHLGISIDLSDLIPDPNFMGLPEFRLPREAQTIEDVVVHGRNALDINCERLVQSQTLNGGTMEQEAIVQQLGRIFHFIFTGQDYCVSTDIPIEFQYISQIRSLEDLLKRVVEQSALPTDQNTAFFGHQGQNVFYIAPNGQALHRYSPLCSRLIPFISHVI